MKKKHHGLLTMALTALLTVTALTITVTIYAQRDQVVMTEEIVYGDKALVSDVLLTHHTTMGGSLVWHTTVPLWDMTQANTDFQASRTYIDSPSQSSGNMEVDFILNLGGVPLVPMISPTQRTT
ncbi:hypothetical protein RFF05_02930 [Bengtsoniella intestinalis]|uniref:hypothetical protein n=1 Tax=Bengtsoniella intestinalis TaxID=3073143 RepID=UPI00391F7D09